MSAALGQRRFPDLPGCAHCGAPIQTTNYSLGPKVEHYDPDASFRDSIWWHCRLTVATPRWAGSQTSTQVDGLPDASLSDTDAHCGCLVNVPVSGTFTTACEQGAPCGSRPSPPDSPAQSVEQVVCIDCGARQTHRVCAACFARRPDDPAHSDGWQRPPHDGSSDSDGAAQS